MLKKISEFDKKNKTVSSYHNFVGITKKGPFLGPQPLQILPKDVPSLVNDTLLTPKIDGVRYLCLIQKDEIGFINRGMEFFIPEVLLSKNSKQDYLTIKVDTKDPLEIKMLEKEKFLRLDEGHQINTLKQKIKEEQQKKTKLQSETDKLKKLSDSFQQQEKEQEEKLKEKFDVLEKEENNEIEKLDKDKLDDLYSKAKENLRNAIKNRKTSEILKLTEKANKVNYSKLVEKIREKYNEKREKLNKNFEIHKNSAKTKFEKEQNKIIKNIASIKKLSESSIASKLKRIEILEKLKKRNDKLKKSKSLKDKFSKFVYNNKTGKIVKIVKKEVKILNETKHVAAKKINTRTSDKFLLDCEVVESNGILQVFLFDFLLLRKRNSYQKIYKLPFFGRNDHLINLFNSVLKPLNEQMKKEKIPIKFYNKKYYDYNIFIKDMTYEKLIKLNDSEMKLSGNEKIKYDGVIFINTSYRYFLAPGPARGQFKWKPKNQLTIDLKIVKKNKKWTALGKYDRKIEINKKDISSLLDKSKLKDSYSGKVYEFLFVNGKFVIHEPIIDRSVKGANAFFTIKGTIEAGEKHFTLVQFKNFINYMKENKNLTKTDISWIDHETFVTTMALCRGNDFFNKKQKESINKKLLTFFKHNPDEIRLSNEKKKKINDLDERIETQLYDIIILLEDKYLPLNNIPEDDNIYMFLFSNEGRMLLYLNDYVTLLNELNRKFKEYFLQPIEIFEYNEELEHNIKYGLGKPKGLSQEKYVEYKKKRALTQKLKRFLETYKNMVLENEYRIMQAYSPKFENYNKYISVSLVKEKEESSKIKMSNKADDFYKLLSYLKSLTKNPLYSGTKTLNKKVNAGENEYNFIMNRKNEFTPSVQASYEIYSDEIYHSQTLNFEKDLNYNALVELGYRKFHKPSQVRHVGVSKKSPSYFETIFTFYLPGIPWGIVLKKTVKKTVKQLTEKEKLEKLEKADKAKILLKEIKQKQKLSENDKKKIQEYEIIIKNKYEIETETYWEIKAVMPIVKFFDIEKTKVYQSEKEKLVDMLGDNKILENKKNELTNEFIYKINLVVNQLLKFIHF